MVIFVPDLADILADLCLVKVRTANWRSPPYQFGQMTRYQFLNGLPFGYSTSNNWLGLVHESQETHFAPVGEVPVSPNSLGICFSYSHRFSGRNAGYQAGIRRV